MNADIKEIIDEYIEKVFSIYFPKNPHCTPYILKDYSFEIARVIETEDAHEYHVRITLLLHEVDGIFFYDFLRYIYEEETPMFVKNAEIFPSDNYEYCQYREIKGVDNAIRIHYKVYVILKK